MTVAVSASVKLTRAAVFAMVALVAASVVPFMADGSSAESFNEDLGSFNSMAVTVQYSPPAGSDAAETVVWNFGDGSEDQIAGPTRTRTSRSPARWPSRWPAPMS